MRCIGGRVDESNNGCSDGYDGVLCSACDTKGNNGWGYYRRKRSCKPCPEPQPEYVQYLWIGGFILVFNLGILFVHIDVCFAIFDVMAVAQTFYAMGQLRSDDSPEILQQFYAKLSLLSLDFEFNLPGCGGSASDFYSILKNNFLLVLGTAAPMFVIFPLLIVAMQLAPKLLHWWRHSTLHHCLTHSSKHSSATLHSGRHHSLKHKISNSIRLHLHIPKFTKEYFVQCRQYWVDRFVTQARTIARTHARTHAR